VSRYYDRDGKPMDMMAWARTFEDNAYRTVEQTDLPNGVLVSTVWLGLDHQFGDGPPLIFETMVFGDRESGRDLAQERYSTLDEARAGHAAMVKEWSER
jgi:hypothetical protein